MLVEEADMRMGNNDDLRLHEHHRRLGHDDYLRRFLLLRIRLVEAQAC